MLKDQCQNNSNNSHPDLLLLLLLSCFSRVQLFAIPGTIAYQAPLSMGFSRQEHWSGQKTTWCLPEWRQTKIQAKCEGN